MRLRDRIARAFALAAALALTILGSACTPEKREEEIVFWQFSPAERIQPLLARFESEYPGVKVRMEQLTWDSGQEKIAAAVASGNVPDLCELGSTWMPRFIASGSLADWTGEASELRGAMRGVELCESGGRTFGLPWVLGTRALFYNKTLFARAGLDSTTPPETWAELANAAAAIQKLGGGAHGYGVQSNEQYRLFKKFMPYAWGNGGDVLGAGDTTCVFDSPENVEALAFYLSLRRSGMLGPQDVLDREFIEGRLGLQISGGWLFRRIPKEAPGLRYAAALVPKPANDRGDHASFAGGEVLVSFVTSKHPKQAMQLARFLARPDNALALAEASQDVQPAAHGADTAAFYRENPDQQTMLRQFETARFTPNHPAWGDMEKAIEDEVEQALYDRKSAAKAVKDAGAKITALLGSR
jgi:multiple sugar transport system substrate-binding protein